VWLAFAGVWYVYLSEMRRADNVETSTGAFLLNTMLHAYAFIIVVAIALPSLGRRIHREPAHPIRMRLAAILATQIIMGVWLGARMVLSPIILMGFLPRTYPFTFVNSLIGLMILAYSASLLPPSTFGMFARAGERMWDWQMLYRAIKIERLTAHVLGQPTVQLSVRELLSTPDFALYRVIIAILDRRKALRQAASPQSRDLAWQLDLIAAASPEYPDLVASLKQIRARQP
jgi:hypothetical protein